MQHTMAEKVLSRASGIESVEPGQVVTVRPHRLLTNESFAFCARDLLDRGADRLAHPERIAVGLDRCRRLDGKPEAAGHAAMRELARRFEVGHFFAHEGISHQVLCERGLAMPGTLVVGTDPHTTTCGALGAAGTGIGLEEMVRVMATGELSFRVPPSVRVLLSGIPRWGCITSRDLGLYLLGKLESDALQDKSVEFSGDAAESLSAESRMALCNLAADMGAGFALFAADEVALSYITRQTAAKVLPFGPDKQAAYQAEHRVDMGNLEPQVAGMRGPADVRPVSELGEVEIQNAFLGSCAGGRLEDLAVAAAVLRGRRVADDTRLVITPASRQVYLWAVRAGLAEILLEAGADITAPGCGACADGRKDLLDAGETSISNGNRNARGPTANDDTPIYLASAATVAASAVAGRIADPREYWQPEAA
jgi:3-isopropylmalate/(R)-2-methylmalate dehydratase large subunit